MAVSLVQRADAAWHNTKSTVRNRMRVAESLVFEVEAA